MFRNQSLSCQWVSLPFRSPPLHLSPWGPPEAHSSAAVGGHIRSCRCSTPAQPGMQDTDKINDLCNRCKLFSCVWNHYKISRPLKTQVFRPICLKLMVLATLIIWNHMNRPVCSHRLGRCTHQASLAELRQCFTHNSQLSGALVAQTSEGAVQWRGSDKRRWCSQEAGVTGTHGSQCVAVPPQGGEQPLLRVTAVSVSSLPHGGKKMWEEVLRSHCCCVPPEGGEDDTLHFLMEGKQVHLGARNDRVMVNLWIDITRDLFIVDRS